MFVLWDIQDLQEFSYCNYSAVICNMLDVGSDDKSRPDSIMDQLSDATIIQDLDANISGSSSLDVGNLPEEVMVEAPKSPKKHRVKVRDFERLTNVHEPVSLQHL